VGPELNAQVLFKLLSVGVSRTSAAHNLAVVALCKSAQSLEVDGSFGKLHLRCGTKAFPSDTRGTSQKYCSFYQELIKTNKTVAPSVTDIQSRSFRDSIALNGRRHHDGYLNYRGDVLAVRFGFLADSFGIHRRLVS
jgi:hypothetical protein